MILKNNIKVGDRIIRLTVADTQTGKISSQPQDTLFCSFWDLLIELAIALRNLYPLLD